MARLGCHAASTQVHQVPQKQPVISAQDSGGGALVTGAVTQAPRQTIPQTEGLSCSGSQELFSQHWVPGAVPELGSPATFGSSAQSPLDTGRGGPAFGHSRELPRDAASTGSDQFSGAHWSGALSYKSSGNHAAVGTHCGTTLPEQGPTRHGAHGASVTNGGSDTLRAPYRAGTRGLRWIPRLSYMKGHCRAVGRAGEPGTGAAGPSPKGHGGQDVCTEPERFSRGASTGAVAEPRGMQPPATSATSGQGCGVDTPPFSIPPLISCPHLPPVSPTGR